MRHKSFVVNVFFILIATFFGILISSYAKVASFDESFSIAMSQHSFKDIWLITSKDVHPPLYYWMLKVFTTLFGNSIICYRLFSVLGIVCVLILGLIFVSKYWGNNVSRLYILLTALMPFTQYLVTDIRMYSWSMFFITACALSAYRVLVKGKIINYASLLIFAVCGAYTHYFALLGTLVILAVLFVWMLYLKESIGKLIITFFIFMILFSPWIPELVSQMNKVNNKYWIGSLNINEIVVLLSYSFFPKDPAHSYFLLTKEVTLASISVFLILLALVLVYGYRFYKRESTLKDLFTAISLIAIFILSVAIAIGYSLFVKPIIIPRYTTCYLGCLLLGISILFGIIIKGRKLLLIYAFFAVLSVLSLCRFISDNTYHRLEYKKWLQQKDYFKDKKTSNSVFMAPIHSADMLERFSLLYPDNLYFIYAKEKSPYIFLPFKCIEVNKLPYDFDFYLILGRDTNPLQVDDNIAFVKAIENDFMVSDSLLQNDSKIYRMRTIHRD